jgi:hypothetical protein
VKKSVFKDLEVFEGVLVAVVQTLYGRSDVLFLSKELAADKKQLG